MLAEHTESARVLVVDDEQVIREILSEFLTMEGYVVRSVEDGERALSELRLRPYDMVISDLKMPRLSGRGRRRRPLRRRSWSATHFCCVDIARFRISRRHGIAPCVNSTFVLPFSIVNATPCRNNLPGLRLPSAL